MRKHTRLSRTLEVLSESGTVDVAELADEFGVSTATIRRDLNDLADQGLLGRTRGGATTGNVSYELPLRYKFGRNTTEKVSIGSTAAGLVEPHAVVGINGGTTTTEVARALALRADIEQVTVVTNALNIANELAVRRHIKLVVVGGVVQPSSLEIAGPLAAATLSAIRLDVLLLGVDAIDVEGGAFAHNEHEAEVGRLMIERANRVVIVADSSKVGQTAFSKICDVNSVHVLVTDSRIGDRATDFQAAGVAVAISE